MSHRPSLGSRLLVTWRTRNGLLQRRVAQQLDTDPARLSEWETGRHQPGRGSAVDLERLSDGFVTVESWQEPDPGPLEDEPESDAAVSAVA